LFPFRKIERKIQERIFRIDEQVLKFSFKKYAHLFTVLTYIYTPFYCSFAKWKAPSCGGFSFCGRDLNSLSAEKYSGGGCKGKTVDDRFSRRKGTKQGAAEVRLSQTPATPMPLPWDLSGEI
jgi:hypothetical protein